VLGDKDRRFVVLKLGQDFGCLTFERGDEFGAHKVILKWHFLDKSSSSISSVVFPAPLLETRFNG